MMVESLFLVPFCAKRRHVLGILGQGGQLWVGSMIGRPQVNTQINQDGSSIQAPPSSFSIEIGMMVLHSYSMLQ